MQFLVFSPNLEIPRAVFKGFSFFGFFKLPVDQIMELACLAQQTFIKEYILKHADEKITDTLCIRFTNPKSCQNEGD